MRGAFDDEEFEPIQRRHDAELTLGSGTLLAIFFGLVLLCGLFFGLGYAVGHRSAPPAQEPATSAPTAAPAANAHPKPSATQQGSPAKPSRAAADQSPSAPADTHSSTASQAAQPQVRPALPAPSTPPQPAQAYRPEPAPAAAGALMVQIAAVTHPEDAEVLVNALRRRGYAVTARREVNDGLIHVRVGPFSNRNDANQWRQKLLNDGYNAILQP